MKNTFQLFATFLAIQDTEKKGEILALLQRHKNDILETGKFSAVNVLQLEDQNSMAVMLIPKSPDDWKQYCIGPRLAIKDWFIKHLLDSGLVTITSTWEPQIEVPVATTAKV